MPSGQMSRLEVRCALVGTLARRHKWGKPMSKDDLVNLSGIGPANQGTGKDVYDELKREPYIKYDRNRGIKINSSRQGEAAEFLRSACGWTDLRLKSTFKHYEGFDR